MTETLARVLAGVAGLLLGGMFFGGLWWTIRRGVSSPRPALWFVVSLLLRTGVAVAGFVLVARGDWPRLTLCLLGFAAARLIATWLTRPSTADKRFKEEPPCALRPMR